MEIIEGGVTAAEGFMASGCAAGIKKDGRADMAMIFSKKPCVLAGTFTTNVVKAAPVIWDRQLTKDGKKAQAIIVNSGVANACTGEKGLSYCRKTAEAASEALGISADSVLVASTGVIGAQIPIEKIVKGISGLKDTLGDGIGDGTEAAKAIMTTDTVSKEAAVSILFSDGKNATLGGCCKGSGMIHPNMCTMLCFLTTDACISKEMLQKALSEVVPDTFNMVSVDGDTSTNDTCLLLSNGLAGNRKITEENEDYAAFKEGLLAICTRLSKSMAKDGEGATALFEVRVLHAASKEDAKILARSVVSSTLTKAAISGHDANWGRILCALGYAGVSFDPDKVDLYFKSSAGSLMILYNGVATGYSEEEATEILSQDEITALVDLKMGDYDAEAWGCDLTHKYVDINADYRS
ncbi:MAG TPA: bifunctional glutamate N-acetyltransferase/amino-acid acetyltransferase ArgJ [Lachnospiraceae bacterium]|nr:bifunctional glutamate N-acetyltransferase/amino-acid acetyltransferase ArgJ [Lachnospiraceae bacterium]